MTPGVFTIYCVGETEASRHERQNIDELMSPFGEVQPGSNQTLIGDRPIVRQESVTFLGDSFAVAPDSMLADEKAERITARSRTRYECPMCGLNVTVTSEQWDRRVREQVAALVDHGLSELAIVALGRMVSGS